MRPLRATPGAKTVPEPDQRQGDAPGVPFSPFNPSAGVDLAEAFSSRATDLEQQGADKARAMPSAGKAGAAHGGAAADMMRATVAPSEPDAMAAHDRRAEGQAEPLIFTRSAPRPIPDAKPFAPRSAPLKSMIAEPDLRASPDVAHGQAALAKESATASVAGEARKRWNGLVRGRSVEGNEAKPSGAPASSRHPKPAKKPARRDPAPSRIAYRLHRLWLRPGFRRLVKQGVPLFFLLGLMAGYLGQPDNRERIWAKLDDMRQAIEQRPQFQVRAMQITGASQSIAQDIREILAVDFPVSTFDLDLEGMKARVAELGAVRQVAVRIQPGGVLSIDVQERQPAVVWRVGSDLELLDEAGHRVAEIGARAERSDLPLLAGAGADLEVTEALTLLKAATPVRARIRGLVRVGERRWDLVLDRGQRIMLPEKGALAALEQVMAMAEAQDVLERDIVAVDMRNQSRPTIRLRAENPEKINVVNEIRPGVNGE